MSSPASASSSRTTRTSGRNNPLAALGLRRVGPDGQPETDPESDPDPDSQLSDDEVGSQKRRGGRSSAGIELNRRGLPARKRKRNSLIFGAYDDVVVTFPIRSPKKARTNNSGSNKSTPKKQLSFDDDEDEDIMNDILGGKGGRVGDDDEDEDSSGTRFHRRGVKKKTKGRVSNSLGSTPTKQPSTSSARKLNFSRSALGPPSSTSKMLSTSARKGNFSKRLAASFSASKVSSPSKSARKKAEEDVPRLADLELSSPERQAAQALGSALRNLLKLPKGHKWVCYEFFYSNIDKVLFEGENDFMVCLRESFPNLRTRMLTRVEWCKIRRLMGKPRRCSQNFFEEERSELARKRQKIRLLQQRKQTEVTNFKDLPDEIPLQLTIGARVTARLRKPQDGLFLGTVDAYDTSNNTYRVTFDRTGLGTHSVPDFEVLSTQEPELMPLTTFTTPRIRPKPMKETTNIGGSHSMVLTAPYDVSSPLRLGSSSFSPGLANDPLLSGTTPKSKVLRMDGQIGGYPIKFLDQIVRLSKCLKLKRERVRTLRELNSSGEKMKSFGEFISEDFQRKYANTVIELSQVNRDLNEFLENIKDYTKEFSGEAGPTISLPNIIREGCQEDAYNMVNKINSNGDKEYVENPKILALISSMTALMLQVKHLADGERNAFELQALQDAIGEIKQNVNPRSVKRFEDCVEVHMQHILSGLSQMGNLHAFMLLGTKTSRPVQVKTEPVVKAENF